MILEQAFTRNVRSCRHDVKGKFQAGAPAGKKVRKCGTVERREVIIWLFSHPRKLKCKLQSMREKVGEWTTLKKSGCEIEEIAAEINPVVRAWINYYGKFYTSKMKVFMREINLRIVKWARSKYLKVRTSIIKGLKWLKTISEKNLKLFVHWTFGALPTVG